MADRSDNAFPLSGTVLLLAVASLILMDAPDAAEGSDVGGGAINKAAGWLSWLQVWATERGEGVIERAMTLDAVSALGLLGILAWFWCRRFSRCATNLSYLMNPSVREWWAAYRVVEAILLGTAFVMLATAYAHGALGVWPSRIFGIVAVLCLIKGAWRMFEIGYGPSLVE